MLASQLGAGCAVSAHPAFWATPAMATAVGVNCPFTQAMFWLSLGFNNKKNFILLRKLMGRVRGRYLEQF